MLASKTIVREVLKPIAEDHIDKIVKLQKEHNWDKESVNSTISGIREIVDVFDDKLPNSYLAYIRGLDYGQLCRFKEVIQGEINRIQDAERVIIYGVEDRDMTHDFYFKKEDAIKQQISLIKKSLEDIKKFPEKDIDDFYYSIRPYKVSIESLGEYFNDPTEAKKYFEGKK